MRSHTIPSGPSSADQPRAPGEYVISNQNGIGIDIAKVTKVAGKRLLTTVRQLGTINLAATIQNNEVHDTFIQNDPLDGRTYLYNAAGFSTGFNVYDMTDPTKIKQVAEWDLTPECENDWYAHTIDVTHRNGRRYVTMPAEMLLMIDRSRPAACRRCRRATRSTAAGRSSATATSRAHCGSSMPRTSPSSARRTTRSRRRRRCAPTPR